MEKEELELENKPEGGEKEKQAPEQKPAMTYAAFKAQKGRKRGKNRGTGMNKDLAVKIAAVRRRGRSRWGRWRRPLLA